MRRCDNGRETAAATRPSSSIAGAWMDSSSGLAAEVSGFSSPLSEWQPSRLKGWSARSQQCDWARTGRRVASRLACSLLVAVSAEAAGSGWARLANAANGQRNVPAFGCAPL